VLSSSAVTPAAAAGVAAGNFVTCVEIDVVGGDRRKGSSSILLSQKEEEDIIKNRRKENHRLNHGAVDAVRMQVTHINLSMSPKSDGV
jgi:hypothetical protein